MEVMLNQDAVIFAAPTYDLMANATFLKFMHRNLSYESTKERKWLGDKNMGWCPNCHSNALILGEPQWDGVHFPIECQVCGAGGDLEKTEDGKWKFVIAENGLCRDRTTIEGRTHHLREIECTQGGFYTEENLKTVKEKFEKYKNIKFEGIEIKK